MVWKLDFVFMQKSREFQKNIYLCFIDYTVNPHSTVRIMKNCGKLLKRWEYQTILPVSWETCMWVKKQQLEPYIEQLIRLGFLLSSCLFKL